VVLAEPEGPVMIRCFFIVCSVPSLFCESGTEYCEDYTFTKAICKEK